MNKKLYIIIEILSLVKDKKGLIEVYKRGGSGDNSTVTKCSGILISPQQGKQKVLNTFRENA